MDVIKFTQFINESKINESVTLYRIVPVPAGESLVVDTDSPGKYYFKDKSDVKPDVLTKKGLEYFIVEVETDSSNIDDVLSEEESEEHGCKCVVLSDDSKAEVKQITKLAA